MGVVSWVDQRGDLRGIGGEGKEEQRPRRRWGGRKAKAEGENRR